jgi:hypothetical protein
MLTKYDVGGTVMRTALIYFAAILISTGITQVAFADDEFYGILESKPDNGTGIWMVGKRSVKVTEETELEEEHGPLDIGACVEVEVENGWAEEIESEAADKCRQ